jgi:hypothetical protein
MESKNSKCQIRDGPGYGAYLDQLTGGIIDVSEDRNEVGGLIYKTSEAAREMFNKGKEEVKKIAAIPGANW